MNTFARLALLITVGLATSTVFALAATVAQSLS